MLQICEGTSNALGKAFTFAFAPIGTRIDSFAAFAFTFSLVFAFTFVFAFTPMEAPPCLNAFRFVITFAFTFAFTCDTPRVRNLIFRL